MFVFLASADCATGGTVNLPVNGPLAELNHRLGLPPLNQPNCHGYACCCVCEDCIERQRLTSGERREIVQPWEIENAAA